MILKNLPYPPSVNSYYRAGNGKVLISKKGREYRKRIEGIVLSRFPKLCADYGFIERVEVRVELYPPDKRKRDIDNPVKALLDSLEKAFVFEEDEQIKRLHVAMHDPVKGGRVDVEIKPLEKQNECKR